MPKVIVRKTPWRNTHKKGIVRGLPLTPSAIAEQRYYMRLRLLIVRMTTEVEFKLTELFKSEHATEYFAEDKSIAAQAKILSASLTRKFNDLFAENAKPDATQMADDMDKSSKVQLQASFEKLTGSLSLPPFPLTGKLNDILAASISENVSLIKSISQQYLAGVEGAVMRSITTGRGLADLVPYLANHKEITLRRARMIASDQASKAFQGLTFGRMKNLGLSTFEWLHVASNHPRKTHIEMSGKIYDINNPPIDPDVGFPILPGQLINCRCKAIPILKFNDE